MIKPIYTTDSTISHIALNRLDYALTGHINIKVRLYATKTIRLPSSIILLDIINRQRSILDCLYD